MTASASSYMMHERLEEGPVESPAYPGLQTLYQKYFVEGRISPSEMPGELRARYGLLPEET